MMWAAIQELLACGCYDVMPVRVTIGNREYIGLHYKQLHSYLPGSFCWYEAQRGARPYYYIVEGWKLFGDVRDFKKDHRSLYERCAFSDGAGKEFYISGWQGGEWFLMFPWPSGHGAIDAGEEKPYKRVPMAIESLVTV